MIRLSVLEVFDMETKEGDIEIEFTGLREGAKVFEELNIGDEVIVPPLTFIATSFAPL